MIGKHALNATGGQISRQCLLAQRIQSQISRLVECLGLSHRFQHLGPPKALVHEGDDTAVGIRLDVSVNNLGEKIVQLEIMKRELAKELIRATSPILGETGSTLNKVFA